MPEPEILSRMLDRLFASLINGPNINCRPHASRQRVDRSLLGRLGDISPDQALASLLEKGGKAKIVGRVPPVKGPAERGARDDITNESVPGAGSTGGTGGAGPRSVARPTVVVDQAAVAC